MPAAAMAVGFQREQHCLHILTCGMTSLHICGRALAGIDTKGAGLCLPTASCCGADCLQRRECAGSGFKGRPGKNFTHCLRVTSGHFDR